MFENLNKSIAKVLNAYAVPEEAIAVFWEVVIELVDLLPNGWKVAWGSLSGCSSNAGKDRLLGATCPMIKYVVIDLGYLCNLFRITRVPAKGTFKFKIWKWMLKSIIKIFVRHEFRHANQFEYLEKHGVPWWAAFLAESKTPYMDQVCEKDARAFQYFGIAQSLGSAMKPIIKMVRG